jgi:hypothetical protein
MRPLVEESLVFLRAIGMEVEIASDPLAESFVPGVWMDEGRLVVHPPTAHASDILHEAGHLATVPTKLRDLTRPGLFPGVLLEEACGRFMQEYPLNLDDCGSEDPVIRGILQMGDCEASAWSFAAAFAMGVSPEMAMIQPRDDGSIPYGDIEEAQTIVDSLQRRQYLGINGLAAAKFCKLREFPMMLRWLGR